MLIEIIKSYWFLEVFMVLCMIGGFVASMLERPRKMYSYEYKRKNP